MARFIKNMSSILLDIKTYLVVKLKYPNRYKNSIVESFIFPNTKIGEKVIIKHDCIINSGLKSIGKGTYIGAGTKIFECQEIGNFCSLSHDVRIGLSNHALDHVSTNPLFYDKARGLVSETTFNEKSTKKTIIEHDVLISANVLIMAGVRIGTGSIIGAGSFVNKDIPPYSIVVGSPAKIIKSRFDDKTKEDLLKSKWWEMGFEELKKKEHNFKNPSKFINE